MGVDYSFYPRKYIEKEIYNIKMNREHYSIEGYRFNSAEAIIDLFQLPKLPYYYAVETSQYEPDNFKLWMTKSNLPNYYRTQILVRASSEKRNDDNYREYIKWQQWGINKLNQIKESNILELKDLDMESKEILIRNLTEVKKDIPLFLMLYKEHYYMVSEV